LVELVVRPPWNMDRGSTKKEMSAVFCVNLNEPRK
jgi:hypothetical protein